jgi:hypothetical protein
LWLLLLLLLLSFVDDVDDVCVVAFRGIVQSSATRQEGVEAAGDRCQTIG